MEIKTRLNLGDTMISVEPDGVRTGRVEAIEITQYGVYYRNEHYHSVKEELCFRDSDELKGYVDTRIAEAARNQDEK